MISKKRLKNNSVVFKRNITRRNAQIKVKKMSVLVNAITLGVNLLFVLYIELISKPGCPIVVYSVSGQPAWEGKADGVSGADR
jgi:hypothetical protein